MSKTITELRDEIVSEFSTHWRLNDEAHRYEHFWQVELCANEINDILGLNINPKLILFAAFFHDLFAWSRVNHHELSYQYVLTTDHPLFSHLTDHERHQVAIACRHHRASYKGRFVYTLDELINSADRMIPKTNLTDMIKRALQYSLGKGNHPVKAVTLTFEHFKESVLDPLVSSVVDSKQAALELPNVAFQAGWEGGETASISVSVSPEEKLKAFAEECRGKFIPLLTSAGVCSITSTSTKDDHDHDIEVKVRPFNSNLKKRWFNEIKTSQIFYIRLPLDNGFVFKAGWWYESPVALQQFAAIKAAIGTMIAGEVMEVLMFYPNKS